MGLRSIENGVFFDYNNSDSVLFRILTILVLFEWCGYTFQYRKNILGSSPDIESNIGLVFYLLKRIYNVWLYLIERIIACGQNIN